MLQNPNTSPFWRVLVVDDLPIWADSVSLFANHFNCQVHIATNLSKAVQELAVWRPHLIILDLHMPRDPWEPIPRLRQKYRPNQKTLAFCEQVTSHPELRKVVVAMASVEEQREQQEQAWQAGAHYFFNKGNFTVETFEKLLHHVQEINTPTPS